MIILLKRILLVGGLATSALAGKTMDAKKDCPDGWYMGSLGENSYCCPGSFIINGDSEYCCLQDTNFQSAAHATPTFASCFPFCEQEIVEGREGRRDDFETSCAANIEFGDKDYTSKVSSASESLISKNGGEKTNAPATNSAEATETASNLDPTSTSGGKDRLYSSQADQSANYARSFPTNDILGAAVGAAAILVL